MFLSFFINETVFTTHSFVSPSYILLSNPTQHAKYLSHRPLNYKENLFKFPHVLLVSIFNRDPFHRIYQLFSSFLRILHRFPDLYSAVMLYTTLDFQVNSVTSSHRRRDACTTSLRNRKENGSIVLRGLKAFCRIPLPPIALFPR